MFAQNNYGYDGKLYTDIEALAKCFDLLNQLVHENNNNFGSKIAMPYKVGYCRGGANWEDVYAIMKSIFADCDVELWRLDKG